MKLRSLCPTCGTALPGDAPEALCPRCLLKVALPGPEAERRGFAPPAPAALGPLFPQLEILGLIGRGGMGAVYKARQVKLDRPVALKVLPQRDDDPAFAERFLREARALAKLQHPHVVTVHDFGEAGGLYYLLMEHVDGTNLRSLLKSGRVAPAHAVRIMAAVCEALEYAHRHEVVHRDIKPENVLLDRAGRVKIADFGLAKLLSPNPAEFTLTDAGAALGTPHYMAPEQLERPAAVDHRADIYAAGVVLYELLTGELPLGRFAPPSARAGTDPRLDEVVLKALESDPERRYQSAGAMAAALAGLAAPAAAPAEGEPEAMDPAYEWLSLLGVLVSGLAVALSVNGTRSGWLAFALFGVERLANAIPWRRPRRPLVGQVLILVGIATSAAILTADPNKWWMLFLIWFWYGEKAYRYFKAPGAADDEDDEGLTPRERRLVEALRKFDDDLSITADIDADQQQAARDVGRVPPEERALALWPLTFGDDAAFTLLVTGAAVYLLSERAGAEPEVRRIALEEFAGRTIVNHGKSVYLGDGTSVTPHPPGGAEHCETLCNVLNAVRKVA